MKKFLLILTCLVSLCSLASCHDSDGKADDSSQATTGKKSHFVIEEVTGQ